MIQRIQSLYLLLTSLLSVLFLSGSFLKFFNKTGSEIIMNFSGIWLLSGAGTPDLIQAQIPLSIIAILIPVISLTAIFLYKKRRLQMKLTIGIIFLDIVLLLYLILFAYLIINRYNVELVPFISMIIPPLVLILSILAYTRIKKDENLVRSYDRLR
jgi:hypothetical protein